MNCIFFLEFYIHTILAVIYSMMFMASHTNCENLSNHPEQKWKTKAGRENLRKYVFFINNLLGSPTCSRTALIDAPLKPPDPTLLNGPEATLHDLGI